MPLKSGYGNKTVSDNVGELIAAGHNAPQSAAIAFALARKSFFRHYPGGALPAWLAYPKGYRLIGHYDKNGKPLMIGHSQRMQRADIAREYNKNPTPRKEIEQAAKLYEDFTGRAPESVEKIPLPKMPRAGLVFGQLIRVGYRSARDGLLYEHTFRTLKSRPLLIASSDGKTVLIAGGRYAFTDRGIEDK